MTYLFVGAGQAGGAIVDAIFEYTDDSLLSLFGSGDISTIGQPLVFNSTVRDLQNLSNVSEENQYGISEQDGVVKGTEPGFEEMVTGGFGRDPVKADDVMREHASQLRGVFERRFGGAVTPDVEADSENGVETAPVDDGSVQFAFVFFGLGGGTGCGISPHIARAITEFEDRAKVIAVPILPNTDGPVDSEDDAVNAGRQAWNAEFGLDRIESEADGIILVDNQRISYLESSAGQFAEYNEYVAAAIHDLVAGPVFSSVDASQVEGVDTPDIDVRDILTSLSFGVGGTDSEPGYAAIGRSVTMTHSLSGYLLPFVGKRDIDSAALARLAVSKQTLSDVDPKDAKKAISLIRVPSSYVGPGEHSIETGTIKEYLDRSCTLSENNLGVALSRRKLASVTTLLTYQRSDIDRLDEIEEVAESYEERTEELLA